MEFIELKGFVKTAHDLFSDDDIRELQNALLKYPENGDLIAATGGMRKMRWSVQGKGKRGGARVIYFFRVSKQRLFLIVAYPKKFFAAMVKELV
jgi:hypothetical protein